MKRVKRHKVKTEVPETSTSHNRDQETHDLAYYIHDRVELMHQVFSVLKYKELKAMAPACTRNISIDDLQELCTEELLGISSKRLCAILDGAEPPSDTESSSPSSPTEQFETISLDSISSDDEILSQASSKKKKHKHRRRNSRSKSKRKKSNDREEEVDRSKASRAGLTVLELLELQARARAIRAQLQQEQHIKPVSESVPTEHPHSSDNEVEIKEEPAEVVEISSDEEKPKVEELQKKISQDKDASPSQPTTVTKHINDLVITVPQNSKQKIKLNRNKTKTVPPTEKSSSVGITLNTNDEAQSVATTKNASPIRNDKPTENKKTDKRKDKSRKKKKEKKSVAKDDDDNDEITLQLSDTEKMDLLEDLDRKNYDSVSSDTSSDSSSDSDVPKKETSKLQLKEEDIKPDSVKKCLKDDEKLTSDSDKVKPNTDKTDSVSSTINENENVEESPEKATSDIESTLNTTKDDNIGNKDETLDSSTVQGQPITENADTKSEIVEVNVENEKQMEIVKEIAISTEKVSDSTVNDAPTEEVKDQIEIGENNGSQVTQSERNLSEGELSDRESSEVEAVDLKMEVVCISDEEGSNKSKKKKKKKDKKSKKEKKSKKKSNFRESADQNFYKDNVEIIEDSSQVQIVNPPSLELINNSSQSDHSLNDPPIYKNVETHIIETVEKVDLTADKPECGTIDSVKTDITFSAEDQTVKNEVKSINTASSSNFIFNDDIEEVCEIFELSDSSCDVECTILSKEPTTLEIEALSAKIDEIDRVEVITDKEIREYERKEEEKMADIENISWKDRYLDSKKVKTVMNTANIFNALRKKNKELKRKLEESKKENVEHEPQNEAIEIEKKAEEPNILEGSIEHYNTLEGSTKYVDPVKELPAELPSDLKKDAKLLLKMYKKLLKYNDINKKDPNKKKKKKKKNKKVVEAKDDDTKIINTAVSVQSQDVTTDNEERIVKINDIDLEYREVDDSENIEKVKNYVDNVRDDLAIQEESFEKKVEELSNLDNTDIVKKRGFRS